MDILSLGLLTLMGAMSPGPDFAIVTRFALTGCRKSAILASLGVSAAILIHLSYCFFGLALLLQNKTLFTIIQIAGSVYLAYIGVKLLLPSKGEQANAQITKKAFRSGFITNLLNPKASLFFLSIFSQLGIFGLTYISIISCSLIILTTTFVWFCGLSFFITHKAFLPYFTKFQHILMKIMGFVLISLSISSFLSLL